MASSDCLERIPRPRKPAGAKDSCKNLRLLKPSGTMSALLSASEIRLRYGHQTLLDGVTFAVAAGEKVGMVGRNGCGKTSLLKILSSLQAPDSGKIALRRGLRVGYLPQEFELDPERSVGENISAGAADLVEALRRYENNEAGEPEWGDLTTFLDHTDAWNLDARIKATATALAAPPLDAPTAPLSGGEKRRVALCRALACQPDLLLLDEPTNHLDAESIRWLENALRNFSGAVIFVTHDRYFLDVIATRIVEIDHGRAFSHPGNYTAYLESKALRQQIASQTERRRQRFLRSELEWVRSGVKARGTKSRHRLDAFYEVEGIEAPPEEREMDLLIPPPPALGDLVVELENAGVNIGTATHPRWLFRHLDLRLEAGQCTGIVGRNGVGKTTLLKLCLGQLAPTEGRARIGPRVRANCIDQTRMQLDATGSLLDEISGGRETLSFGEQTLGARAYLRRFLFSDQRIHERVDILSGGERARLMLAKVLKTGGNLLVLDEPTNDLDLPSLRMLEDALADFDGTVLCVSHDRYFLDRICDQIVAFEEDGVFVQPGNYSYYLEKRLARENAGRIQAQAARKQAEARAKAAEAAKRPRKLTLREREELAGIEDAIHAAEERAAALSAQLDDPAFQAQNYLEIPARVAELEQANQSVARLYERWEELERIQAAAGT